MIKVIVGTTTQRAEKNYPADTTIRKILENNNVDYSVSQIMMDGASLNAGDLDKTLSDMGIKEKTMLVAAVKASNA